MSWNPFKVIEKAWKYVWHGIKKLFTNKIFGTVMKVVSVALTVIGIGAALAAGFQAFSAAAVEAAGSAAANAGTTTVTLATRLGAAAKNALGAFVEASAHPLDTLSNFGKAAAEKAGSFLGAGSQAAGEKFIEKAAEQGGNLALDSAGKAAAAAANNTPVPMVNQAAENMSQGWLEKQAAAASTEISKQHAAHLASQEMAKKATAGGLLKKGVGKVAEKLMSPEVIAGGLQGMGTYMSAQAQQDAMTKEYQARRRKERQDEAAYANMEPPPPNEMLPIVSRGLLQRTQANRDLAELARKRRREHDFVPSRENMQRYVPRYQPGRA